jgi:hypothetical protein
MARWIKSGMKIAGSGIAMMVLSCGMLNAQGESVPLDLKPPPKKPADFRWQVDQRLVQALGKNTQTGAKVATRGAGGFTGGVDNAIITILRKQSAAASSQIGSASQVELNPQPLPPKASGGMLGPSQTMSAPGQTNISTGPKAGMLDQQSGPVRHQGPGADRTPQPAAAKAPAPTKMCMNGIATVDGQKYGVVFAPVSGPEGTFVIQGCGFGTKAGEVYLGGMRYVPSAAQIPGQPFACPLIPCHCELRRMGSRARSLAKATGSLAGAIGRSSPPSIPARVVISTPIESRWWSRRQVARSTQLPDSASMPLVSSRS